NCQCRLRWRGITSMCLPAGRNPEGSNRAFTRLPWIFAFACFNAARFRCRLPHPRAHKPILPVRDAHPGSESRHHVKGRAHAVAETDAPGALPGGREEHLGRRGMRILLEKRTEG